MKHFKVIFFLFFFLCSVSVSSTLNPDGLSLLALKSAINGDPTQALISWSESDPTPCHWAGITCDRRMRVTTVSLSGKNLSGYIPSELGALSSLSSLQLSNNNLSNTLPASLFNASSLTFLDLSHNSLSGPLPNELNQLLNLTHLDLSANLLSGSLPNELNLLSNLRGTLNLSFNLFSGEVPASFGLFPVTLSLDLRHNNLTGKIPPVGSLLNQGPTAFSDNPFLCGFPLQNLCSEPEAKNPNQENPQDPNFQSNGYSGRGKQRNGLETVSLVSCVSVVIVGVFVSLWIFRKKLSLGEGKIGKETLSIPEVVVGGGSGGGEGQNGKYVAIDEGFVLELEDLLRASAYVVGKGRSGIVYKVVAGAGRGPGASGGVNVVAVRRLSEGDSDNAWRFKEFEGEVEAIARVQHPNVVRLRAYYYASDEKLLVTDFISNGNLHNALHGGPGVSLPTLSWVARLKIAQGIARGLVHIHELSPKRYVHGNIKSSKILLDEELVPYISGFGLTRLAPTTSKLTTSASRKKTSSSNPITPSPRSSTSGAYKAPEARVSGSKITQKCDVYSFGIVLLEILTGRAPDDDDGKGLDEAVREVFREERALSEIIDPVFRHEVESKKQVVATFHIALNCTELDPEFRPRMRSVAESLERISLLQ